MLSMFSAAPPARPAQAQPLLDPERAPAAGDAGDAPAAGGGAAPPPEKRRVCPAPRPQRPTLVVVGSLLSVAAAGVVGAAAAGCNFGNTPARCLAPGSAAQAARCAAAASQWHQQIMCATVVLYAALMGCVLSVAAPPPAVARDPERGADPA